jgi:hypothetical protein
MMWAAPRAAHVDRLRLTVDSQSAVRELKKAELVERGSEFVRLSCSSVLRISYDPRSPISEPRTVHSFAPLANVQRPMPSCL